MSQRISIAVIFLAIFSGSLLLFGRTSQAAVTFTVNSTADPGVGGCNATECTLREAIDAANANSGLDTIDFDPTVFPTAPPAAILVHGELPDITEALTIDGTGAGVVIEPEPPENPEDIGLVGLIVRDTDETSPTNFTLIGNDFTIRGFSGTGIIICGRDGPICGGAIESVGPIEGVTITGSTIVGGSGAGIHIYGNNVSDVSIDGNPSITGGEQGVSIDVPDPSTSNVSNVSIDGNGEITGDIHHGIAIFGLVTDVSISGNGSIAVSTGPGEGIYMPGDSITNVSIDDNASISAVNSAICIGNPGGKVSKVSVTHNDSIVGTDVGVSIDASDMQGIIVDHNGEIRGETERAVNFVSSSPGLVISNFSVSGNESIIGGETGIMAGGHEVSNGDINENGSVIGGVQIGGETVDHVAIDDNDLISGDFAGVHIDGATVSDVSISGNTSIAGAGVHVGGDHVEDVSVEDNGSIAGPAAVHIGGDNVEDVSVEDNDSIAGTDVGVSVAANVASEDVSVRSNDSIIGGQAGIAVQGPGNVDIVVRDNESIVGGDQGVSIGGGNNSHISVRGNGEIAGEIGVNVWGEANTGVSVRGNDEITGNGGGALRIDGESNTRIVVRGNESLSDPGAEGVSIIGDTNRRISVVDNPSISAAIGINVESGINGRRMVIAGNDISSSLAGIVIVGPNPDGPRNVVLGNDVEASVPEAVFGIVLLGAKRTLVAFNRVTGFEGEFPGLGGGGIAVILESSRNLILANVVDSEPDLF